MVDKASLDTTAAILEQTGRMRALRPPYVAWPRASHFLESALVTKPEIRHAVATDPHPTLRETATSPKARSPVALVVTLLIQTAVVAAVLAPAVIAPSIAASMALPVVTIGTFIAIVYLSAVIADTAVRLCRERVGRLCCALSAALPSLAGLPVPAPQDRRRNTAMMVTTPPNNETVVSIAKGYAL